MGSTAGTVFGGAKAPAPGAPPQKGALGRDIALITGSVLGGLLLNKALTPKAATPPYVAPAAPPSTPKPPKMVAPPDLTLPGGTTKKSGRNATLLTGPSGLGTISGANVQTKSLLGY